MRGVGEERPLVTVVIPTCRRPGMLGRALASVLGQTYRNLEVIVADDNVPGSVCDIATREEVARRADGDGRVRLVPTAGGVGGGAARSLACGQAGGEYLAFLDDDDEFLPDKVQTQLRFMREAGLDMSWQDVAWYDERGGLVERRVLDHCRDFSREGLLRAHVLTPISPTSIYMLRRSLFERTEGFGEVATGQDWWLMLRCIEADARIGYMPGVHVRQYLHAGERLSVGLNKIEGEAARRQVVRRYHPLLTRGEVRYVEFRHNAALAFACARGGMRVRAVGFALRALAASPRACVTKGIEFLASARQGAGGGA